MRIEVQKVNFNGGEIKPELWAREDLAANNYGAMFIENRVPMPEGGTIRRSGTKLVCALLDETQIGKLVPFKFSRTDARVLIFSGGEAKVGYAGGGLVQAPGGGDYAFALPAAWTPAVLPNIRWTESAGQIFLVDGLQMPTTIKRLADTNWQVAPYEPINGPVAPQNLDQGKTLKASGVSGAITLTANFDAFQPGHVGSFWRLDEGDLGSIPYWTAIEQIAVTASTSTPATYRRNSGAVYAAFAGPGVTAGTISVGVNAPTQTSGTFVSAAGCASWQFKYFDHGYVKITGVLDARHAQATVIGVGQSAQTVLPDSVAAAPTYRWSEGAWSGVRGFPSLTAFAQQRLGFFVAYQFYLTYSGDYVNFAVDTSDASSISGALLAIDGSLLQPQWTYSSGWVVVGCADSEPVIRGPNVFDALTQTNVLAVVDKGQGSAWHIPASVDAGVVNIGVSRRRVHYTKINRLFDTIEVTEISVNSNHILRGHAAGVAYQHDPNRVIWGYSQDGSLWSYTFRPDQQVSAAARHPMPGGAVEDICAIPTADGMDVEIWMIVRRLVGGRTRRFVEVMQPFFTPADEAAADARGAWFVDCALRYQGAPSKSIGGAEHLANTVARVFGDGRWFGDRKVNSAGFVSLPVPASDVVVGLPIKARLRTLPLDPVRPGSTTRGDVKQATHATADYLHAFGGFAYPWSLDDQGTWQEPDGGEGLFPSGALTPGQPVPLFTGRKSFPLAGVHGRIVSLEIVDDHPYPSTLLALAPDIEDGEV